MQDRRPSLNAVRIFAIAARRRSIAAAAADLGVTPGAVSHQIKALEADLGVALFERLRHAIERAPELDQLTFASCNGSACGEIATAYVLRHFAKPSNWLNDSPRNN